MKNFQTIADYNQCILHNNDSTSIELTQRIAATHLIKHKIDKSQGEQESKDNFSNRDTKVGQRGYKPPQGKSYLLRCCG